MFVGFAGFALKSTLTAPAGCKVLAARGCCGVDANTLDPRVNRNNKGTLFVVMLDWL